MVRIIIVAAVFIALLLPAGASADFQKTKIAVLDFQLQGSGYETEDMGKIVAEWFTTALVKEGRFEVVERRLLNKVLDEQNLHMTGLIDSDSTASVGRILGVKTIISGSVMKLQNILEVNARIIDVESGSIVAAESVKSNTAIRLQDLVVQMAEIIIKNFPLEGYIVFRNDTAVTIDLGRSAGVRPGMRFIVYQEGNIIKHPKTGEILDVEMNETGKIEIKTIQENIADARIINETIHHPIAYGQLVKSISSRSNTVSIQDAPSNSSYNAGLASHSEAEYLYQQKRYDDVINLLQNDPQAAGDYPSQVLLAKAQIEKCVELKENGDLSYQKLIYTPYQSGAVLLQSNPRQPEPYYIIGKSLVINHRAKKGAAYLAKAVYFAPQNIEYLVAAGDAYREAENFSAAVGYYENALAQKPEDEPLRAEIEDKLEAARQNKKGSPYQNKPGNL